MAYLHALNNDRLYWTGYNIKKLRNSIMNKNFSHLGDGCPRSIDIIKIIKFRRYFIAQYTTQLFPILSCPAFIMVMYSTA